MKHLLFISFLFIAFAAVGQGKKVAPKTAYIIQTSTGSDTLELVLPLQFHFIKIGNNVYQIVEPAPIIQKVEPAQPTIRFWNGGTGDATLPLIHIQPV